MLERLDTPLIDRRNIALNLATHGDAVAAAERTERRAAMIAGDPIEPEEKAA